MRHYLFYLEGNETYGIPVTALADNLDTAFTIAQRDARIYKFRCLTIRFIQKM